MSPKLAFPDRYNPPMMTVIAEEYLKKCTKLPQNMKFTICFAHKNGFKSWVIQDRILKFRQDTGFYSKAIRWKNLNEWMNGYQDIQKTFLSVGGNDYYGYKIFQIGEDFKSAIIHLEKGLPVDLSKISISSPPEKKSVGRPRGAEIKAPFSIFVPVDLIKNLRDKFTTKEIEKALFNLSNTR